MKNYEQMASSVISKINKKKRQRANMVKLAGSLCCVAILAIMVLPGFNHNKNTAVDIGFGDDYPDNLLTNGKDQSVNQFNVEVSSVIYSFNFKGQHYIQALESKKYTLDALVATDETVEDLNIDKMYFPAAIYSIKENNYDLVVVLADGREIYFMQFIKVD